MTIYHYFFHVDAYYGTAIDEPDTGAKVLGETLQWALQDVDDLAMVKRTDVPIDVLAQDTAQIVGVVGGFWLDADDLLALISKSVRDTGASWWTVTLRDCDDLTTHPWVLSEPR